MLLSAAAVSCVPAGRAQGSPAFPHPAQITLALLFVLCFVWLLAILMAPPGDKVASCVGLMCLPWWLARLSTFSCIY